MTEPLPVLPALSFAVEVFTTPEAGVSAVTVSVAGLREAGGDARAEVGGRPVDADGVLVPARARWRRGRARRHDRRRRCRSRRCTTRVWMPRPSPASAGALALAVEAAVCGRRDGVDAVRGTAVSGNDHWVVPLLPVLLSVWAPVISTHRVVVVGRDVQRQRRARVREQGAVDDARSRAACEGRAVTWLPARPRWSAGPRRPWQERGDPCQREPSPYGLPPPPARQRSVSALRGQCTPSRGSSRLIGPLKARPGLVNSGRPATTRSGHMNARGGPALWVRGERLHPIT